MFPPCPLLCELKNGTSCEECLKNVTCLWCITTKSCVTYPVRTILPPHALCPLNDARWGLCWMNFQILIITLSVIGGILIIAFLVCLFCCCKCENIGQCDAGRIHCSNYIISCVQQVKIRTDYPSSPSIKRLYYTGQNPYSRFS
uniref:PTTG1 interacting protein n=1 Tax=Neolamprologus brichardi TaxID=32507 RepID=A0A3Q4I1K3_NEOBR